MPGRTPIAKRLFVTVMHHPDTRRVATMATKRPGLSAGDPFA